MLPTVDTPLVEQHDDDDAEPDIQVNIQSVIMFKAHQEQRPLGIAFWICCGFAAAVCQLLALFGIRMSAQVQPCLYQEDCNLGFACASLRPIPLGTSNGTTVDSLPSACVGCDYLLKVPII